MQHAGTTIETDAEGFLKNYSDWSAAIAEQIAKALGITLDERHWEIIGLLQSFYQRYELSPPMRPLIQYIGQQNTQEDNHQNKASSIYLLQLFKVTKGQHQTESPAKTIARIAGLPRPKNCL